MLQNVNWQSNGGGFRSPASKNIASKGKSKWYHTTVARVLVGFYVLDSNTCTWYLVPGVSSVNYAYLYLSLDESLANPATNGC